MHGRTNAACGLVALLLAKVSGCVPAPFAYDTLAVFVTAPAVALPATSAVTVNVTLELGDRVPSVALMLPLPLVVFPQLAPALATQLQLQPALVKAFGRVSVTTAPVTGAAPVFVTTIV